MAKRLQVSVTTKALQPKYPGPEFGQQRFAGDVFKGLGVEGVFGQMSNDKENEQAQNNLQLFMTQYTNGLFSPIPPADATHG